jgi:myo-inositol 2-dehydrogenase/D-chiro-inositol 1-dehydrogenase
MQPLGVGVIGCGTAGSDLHLPALARTANTEPVALADPSRAALDHAGERFGIDRRFSDYRDLLADPAVEAVCVTAPNDLHGEIALAAMYAGKHVFMEKPLSASVEECDLLVERASTSGVRTMLGFNLRHHRHVRRARDLIRQGGLGPLKLLTSTSTSLSAVGQEPGWRSDLARGGGLLQLMAVHHVDLWRFLLDDEIEQVASPPAGSGEPLTTTGIVASTSGGVAISSGFSSVSGQSNEFAVFGFDGWLRASIYRFDGFEALDRDENPGGIGRHLRRQVGAMADLAGALGRLRRGGDFRATYGAEWRQFAEAVREDGPIDCTFEDGREVARVMAAVEESMRTGTSVRVRQPAHTLSA